MVKNIIVITGFSGSGKDTIVNKINEKYDDINKIISNTTRPMRKGEKHGQEYYFCKTKEDFFKSSYTEYRQYDTLVNNKKETWYYGVDKSQIKKDKKYIIILDIEGLKKWKNIYKNRILSFFIDVDDNIRKIRVKERGDFDKVEWNRRLEDDKIKFNKEVIKQYCDYVVKNNNLNDCLNDIYQILSKNNI